MEANKKTFTGIDLFKYIAALLIIILHIVENEDVLANGVVYIFTRLAVPFFFIVSGFFFEKGISVSEDSLSYFYKYTKKLLFLYIVWGVFISGFFLIREYIVSSRNESIIKTFALIARRLFIIGPGATWYLLSLLLSIVFIYFCKRTDNEKILMIAILVGFILNFLYHNGSSIGLVSFPRNIVEKAINVVYSGDNNFLLTGIPFTGLGYFFSKKSSQKKPKIISFKLSAFLFLLFTVFRILEYIYIVNSGKNISFMFIPQAVFFFFMALQLPVKINNSKRFRNASTVTYLVHWFILYEIMNPIMSLFGLNPIDTVFYPIKFVLTVFICFIIYIIINKINKKRLNVFFGI